MDVRYIGLAYLHLSSCLLLCQCECVYRAINKNVRSRDVIICWNHREFTHMLRFILKSVSSNKQWEEKTRMKRMNACKTSMYSRPLFDTYVVDLLHYEQKGVLRG